MTREGEFWVTLDTQALAAVAPLLPEDLAAATLNHLLHELPRVDRAFALRLLSRVVDSAMFVRQGMVAGSLFRALQRVGRSWP